MSRYICSFCGYIYDLSISSWEDRISDRRAFESLSEDWSCPWCGAKKDDFELVEE